MVVDKPRLWAHQTIPWYFKIKLKPKEWFWILDDALVKYGQVLSISGVSNLHKHPECSQNFFRELPLVAQQCSSPTFVGTTQTRHPNMEDIYLYLYLYLYYIYHVYTFIHYTSEYQSHVLLQTRFPKALVSSQPNEPSDVLESTSSLLGWTCCTLFLSTVLLRGPHVASGSRNNPHEAFQCAIEPPKPGHLKYLKSLPTLSIQSKAKDLDQSWWI